MPLVPRILVTTATTLLWHPLPNHSLYRFNYPLASTLLSHPHRISFRMSSSPPPPGHNLYNFTFPCLSSSDLYLYNHNFHVTCFTTPILASVALASLWPPLTNPGSIASTSLWPLPSQSRPYSIKLRMASTS
jgi:hypothetical protein